MFVRNLNVAIPDDEKMCCSKKMADYLVKKGFSPVGINNDGKYVFVLSDNIDSEKKKAPFWLKI